MLRLGQGGRWGEQTAIHSIRLHLRKVESKKTEKVMLEEYNKNNLRAGVAILRSGKIDFEAKALIKSDVA